MQALDVFMTKPEQRLAAAVLMQPERDFGTVELLARMGSSRSAGSAVLRRWVAAGLLRERRVGNQRRLSANPEFLLYPELRRMVSKTVGLIEPLAQALAPLARRLDEAFVFGSVATGSDTSDSDIDLALVGDLDLFMVSPLLDLVQQDLGRPVHASIYGRAEWDAADDAVMNAIKLGARLDLMEAIDAQAA